MREWTTFDRSIRVEQQGEEIALSWQERPGGDFDVRRWAKTSSCLSMLAEAFAAVSIVDDHVHRDLGGVGGPLLALVRDPIYEERLGNATGQYPCGPSDGRRAVCTHAPREVHTAPSPGALQEFGRGSEPLSSHLPGRLRWTLRRF